MPTSPMSRFDLPGFDLPLNFQPRRERDQDPFPSLLSSTGVDWVPHQRLIPLREFEMLRIINGITDKEDWERKVYDDAIADKWKQEALSFDDRDVTQKMINWVIDEVRWKASDFRKSGMTTVFNGDVVKSDQAVSNALKLELQEAVARLEDDPKYRKDYHPGSDEKVIDLVHPSLYPLVYGQSRILPNSLVPLTDCKSTTGKGEIVEQRPVEETSASSHYHPSARNPPTTFSQKFQWLPADLELQRDVSDEEVSWKFTSYINNLDPQKHELLYRITEQVISAAIPLWDRTLDHLKNRLPRLQRVRYHMVKYSPELESFEREPEPVQRSDEEDRDFWSRQQDYEPRQDQRWRDSRVLVLPEPGVFEAPKSDSRIKHLDLKQEFGHRGLQVIVKLANIELTPEKQNYDGGSWHAEGQLNEHICATALYYYDNENITSSHLSFRPVSNTYDAGHVKNRQDNYDWLDPIFGFPDRKGARQDAFSVFCKEGRLLTFPNVLQHRAEPFKLQDPTKPGHCKVLALFLVDPQLRIISTANIPPQQRDWWYEIVDQDPQTPIANFPAELRQSVKDSMGHEAFPISLERAKELRMELMEEMKKLAIRKEEGLPWLGFRSSEH